MIPHLGAADTYTIRLQAQSCPERKKRLPKDRTEQCWHLGWYQKNYRLSDPMTFMVLFFSMSKTLTGEAEYGKVLNPQSELDSHPEVDPDPEPHQHTRRELNYSQIKIQVQVQKPRPKVRAAHTDNIVLQD
ncbi:hypothetical protein chiPu_0010929 [Chiloscyllium punctatum]|uniref:Uncharacterized protein n=1 Tax=Chiloscyllium punctatum TaxID=137246 RepID=A0A401SQ15_CHIPU|nr:hypothetical protein [Chiloscyllium punctatum]